MAYVIAKDSKIYKGKKMDIDLYIYDKAEEIIKYADEILNTFNLDIKTYKLKKIDNNNKTEVEEYFLKAIEQIKNKTEDFIEEVKQNKEKGIKELEILKTAKERFEYKNIGLSDIFEKLYMFLTYKKDGWGSKLPDWEYFDFNENIDVSEEQRIIEEWELLIQNLYIKIAFRVEDIEKLIKEVEEDSWYEEDNDEIEQNESRKVKSTKKKKVCCECGKVFTESRSAPVFRVIEKIPDWALVYMMYGDESGLDEEDVKLVDVWMKKNGLKSLVGVEDDSYDDFTAYPAFGFASATVTGIFQ